MIIKFMTVGNMSTDDNAGLYAISSVMFLCELLIVAISCAKLVYCTIFCLGSR